MGPRCRCLAKARKVPMQHGMVSAGRSRVLDVGKRERSRELDADNRAGTLDAVQQGGALHIDVTGGRSGSGSGRMQTLLCGGRSGHCHVSCGYGL